MHPIMSENTPKSVTTENCKGPGDPTYRTVSVARITVYDSIGGDFTVVRCDSLQGSMCKKAGMKCKYK